MINLHHGRFEPRAVAGGIRLTAGWVGPSARLDASTRNRTIIPRSSSQPCRLTSHLLREMSGITTRFDCTAATSSLGEPTVIVSL
jgi:hypothetical protein